MNTPEERYLAIVHELQTLARKAPRVTQQDILEIASMPVEELRRRAIVSRDWHRLFAQCLDGLPALQKFGAAPDGCWDPRTIRRAVEGLLAQETAASRATPEGLLDRVKAAAQRVDDNRAPRSIPADPHSDVDLVLAEVRYWLEGKWPPFWLAAAPAADEGMPK